MSEKRETPLKSFSLQDHHCSAELRLQKLRMVPFFKSLTEEQLRSVNARFTSIHYGRDELIYREGEPAAMLRVVVAGAVKLVSYTPDGEGVLLEMLRPGDYFGNPAAGTGDRYEETAQTQTEACILSISLTEFQEIMKRLPEVAVSVLDITAARLDASRSHIRHLATLSVKQRIAFLLCSLADRFGEERRSGQLIQLPLSRKDLAEMAGTTPETASRIMSRFQEEELITSGRQWVALTDKRALHRLSGGS